MRGVLSIDAGSTGTRAAVVLDNGKAGPVAYRRLGVHAPSPLVMEQDPQEIWEKTLDAAREAAAWARSAAVQIVGIGVANQRATALLWDRRSGQPLGPALSWQDRRYADELRSFAPSWDETLIQHTGRPVGSRAPLWWAARRIEQDRAIAHACHAGRLAFGTLDSWLVWQLTAQQRHLTSATNALAAGAYDLHAGDWFWPWVDRLGCPHSILPPVVDEDGDWGRVRVPGLPDDLPIIAVMGDQHAAMMALDAGAEGQATCIHGTGSFVDVPVATPPPMPSSVDGVFAMLAWRSAGVSKHSLEAYAPTTGAALRWLCEELELFRSAEEINALAMDFPRAPSATFLPALAGSRTPHWRPDATGALVGLTLSTGRHEVAKAVLQGLAHTVADLVDGLLEGLAESSNPAPLRLVCGGGLAASDVLLQLTADFTGLPVVRADDAATASLRGVAYLGGIAAGLWNSMKDIAGQRTAGREFLPTPNEGERAEARAAWTTARSGLTTFGSEKR